ncbi:hypothetical protein DO021_17750 [Desulfobacter hydrogenophilus]|uniref:Uncharacterized protein n=1 Tax=Desulfobacter hydrogenophilus TaxID=2291 RepID=A0A328FCF1_9BACT|nr:hypothetical protein DO021_17750 [Desulfobacter hydrogenophilus]
MKSKIQAQIAKTHNIAVSENDPIWLVVTVCEFIAEEYQQKLAKNETNFIQRMEEKTKPCINRMSLTIAFLFGVVVGMIIQLFFK